MEKIIILGATGLVGTYTAIELKELGYDIIAVGKRKSDNGFFKDYNIPYYSINISQENELKKLPICDVNCIIHLVGNMPAKMEGYNPHKYIDSIVTGTLNVLNYCIKVKATKIIFSQTRADSNHLMGTKKLIPSDIERKFPLKGDHSVYTICKNAAVDLIEHYYYEYGLKRFILRLPTIYAYHPDKYFYVNGKKKIMAYRYIMNRAMKGLSIEIWGDPKRAKEIVYIKDLIQIIRNCIDSELEGGVYNVGRGVGVTLEKQIRGIVKVFSPKNKTSKIVYKPDKPNARQFIHDISKTVNDLNYKPQYDYLSLLKDFKREMELQRFKKLWGLGN